MSFISVEHLCKTFKVTKRSGGIKSTLKNFIKRDYIYVKAINDISFEVDEGEIVGYIGPNGAGKSTTIKVLSGILTPDSGNVKINGMVPYKERKKYVSNIGVVFGQRSQLWWDIPAIDTFDLLKNIYSINEEEYIKTRDELIKLLNIEDIVKVPVRQLSLGQRMRCEIAASLLHKPKILFLDEPTIGLDAVSKKIVRDFVKRINKEYKVTVILTTHDMSDIEALAKRIILIGKGQILYDGSLTKLKNKYNNKHIHIKTKDKLNKISKKGVLKVSKVEDGYNVIIDEKDISVSEFLKYLSSKSDILDIDIENENIDNIIISLYEEYNI